MILPRDNGVHKSLVMCNCSPVNSISHISQTCYSFRAGKNIVHPELSGIIYKSPSQDANALLNIAGDSIQCNEPNMLTIFTLGTLLAVIVFIHCLCPSGSCSKSKNVEVVTTPVHSLAESVSSLIFSADHKSHIKAS